MKEEGIRIMHKGYLPSFSFEKKDGKTFIMDRFCPIAELEGVYLRKIVFKPGGEPLAYWPLCWMQYKLVCFGEGFAGRLKKREIKISNDGEFLNLTLISTTSDKAVKSTAYLTLSYDSSFKSYVYEVKMELVVKEGRLWRVLNYSPWGNLEYCNFNVHDEKRWKHFIYQNQKDRFIKMRLNEFDHPERKSLFIKKEGICGYYNARCGNPVIQLLGNTYKQTRAGLCPVSSDIHLAYDISRDGSDVLLLSGVYYEASYRIFAVNKLRGFETAKRASLKEVISRTIFPEKIDNARGFGAEAGDYIEDGFTVSKEGIYSIYLREHTAPMRGVLQIIIDSKRVGSPIDMRRKPGVVWDRVNQKVKLKKGRHIIRLGIVECGFLGVGFATIDCVVFASEKWKPPKTVNKLPSAPWGIKKPSCKRFQSLRNSKCIQKNNSFTIDNGVLRLTYDPLNNRCIRLFDYQNRYDYTKAFSLTNEIYKFGGFDLKNYSISNANTTQRGIKFHIQPKEIPESTEGIIWLEAEEMRAKPNMKCELKETIFGGSLLKNRPADITVTALSGERAIHINFNWLQQTSLPREE